jgi:hypothetical protein
LFGYIDDVYVYFLIDIRPSYLAEVRKADMSCRDERDPETASEAGSRRPRGSRSGTARAYSRESSEAPSEITVTTITERDEEDEDEEEEEEDADPTPRKAAPSKPRRSSGRQRKVVAPPLELEEEEGTDAGEGSDVEDLLDEEEEEDGSSEDDMLL